MHTKFTSLTPAAVPASDRRMGRKKLWTERLHLPLAEGMKERIRGALHEGEVTVDLIREAIERELERREREKPKG